MNADHQELQDMVLQYPQAVATQTAWLDTCYSRQTRVDATPFLHTFRWQRPTMSMLEGIVDVLLSYSLTQYKWKYVMCDI